MVKGIHKSITRKKENMKNKYKFNTGGISTQKKKNSKQHILNL